MKAIRNRGHSPRHRGAMLRKIAIVCASAGLVSATPGVFQTSAQADALHPPFTECPAVGYNATCSLVIDVTNSAVGVLQDTHATISGDPVPGTYDGVEDTLIGVVNNSSVPVSTLTLSSNSQPLFGFDNDGICQDPNQTSNHFGLHCNGVVHNSNGSPNYFNAHDSTGYGGPNAFFTNISSDFKTGIVHFFTPIPPGGTDYFSLEEKLDSPDFCQDTITLAPPSASSLVGGPAQIFTATILDLGLPASGIPVTFSVTSLGPNNGLTSIVNTNASGQAQFTVPSSSVSAVDTVHASYHDPTCSTVTNPAHSAVPSTMTWNKASPAITTMASPISIIVGTPTTVGDTATFSGGVASVPPTGSVTFTLYSNITCTATTGVSGTGPISTSGGTSTAQFTTATPWSAPAAGIYYWRASYPGDPGNNAVTTACNASNETVAVRPGSPSIMTQASPPSITVGTPTTVGDTATFLNTTSVPPTGLVTFTLYSNNTCTATTGVSGTGPISTSGGTSTAQFTTLTPWTAPATGIYYWQASYPGDLNNTPILTACGGAAEMIVVGPASPTITTHANPASIMVGTATMVGDTATFQTSSTVAPTGSVTFTLYSDSACSTSTGVTGSGAISTSGGLSSASFLTGWVAPATGTYYWQASYAGDVNNNPATDACLSNDELIVVGPGSPKLTTQALPTSMNVGDTATVTDTATFKETTAVAPTGSVTFTLYSNNTCTTSTGITGSGPVSTTGGVSSAQFGASWTASAAGSYYWQAVYPGDANNDAFTTVCGDPNETITVFPAPAPLSASTLLTTSLSGDGVSGPRISVAAGTAVTDTATLIGANVGSAGGSVTYSVYSDSSCRNFVASGGTKNVIPGDVPSSDPVTLTAAGKFYWRVTYSGDAHNGSAVSNCSDEVENVLPLDHFLCYTAKSAPSPDGLGFAVPGGVQLSNQFSPSGFAPKIGAVNLDCNPVEKTVPNGVTKITNPNAHLVCWGISAPSVKKTVVVTNQFGRATLTTGTVTRMCLPSWKSRTGPPGKSPNAPPGLSHFACYTATYAPRSTTFKPPKSVHVKDEYTPKAVRVKVGAPKVLCLPTTKVVNGVTYKAKNAPAHLLCFAVSGTPVKSPVFDENQFGTARVQNFKTGLLCLPSTKVVVSTK